MYKLLFRNSYEFKEEIEIAKNYFEVETNRTKVKDCAIIPRYCCLPYYQEFVEDLKWNNCKIPNTYNQHRYIANFEYYEDVKEYTFPTWFSGDFHKSDWDGPFVVKGVTNSRKSNWNTHMFAPTKDRAWEISKLLYADMVIGSQEIIFRKFIKLKTFEYGINGLPFTNEFRFFFYKEHLIDYGFYWSISDSQDKAHIDETGINFAKKVAEIISKKVNFFVLDIALTEDDNWILVEVNDGQMAGLSDIDPNNFYKKLKNVLDNDPT